MLKSVLIKKHKSNLSVFIQLKEPSVSKIITKTIIDEEEDEGVGSLRKIPDYFNYLSPDGESWAQMLNAAVNRNPYPAMYRAYWDDPNGFLNHYRQESLLDWRDNPDKMFLSMHAFHSDHMTPSEPAYQQNIQKKQYKMLLPAIFLLFVGEQNQEMITIKSDKEQKLIFQSKDIYSRINMSLLPENVYYFKIALPYPAKYFAIALTDENFHLLDTISENAMESYEVPPGEVDPYLLPFHPIKTVDTPEAMLKAKLFDYLLKDKKL
jgi:hypothetical protein